MKDWIEAHGTDALRRAYYEGYEIEKGVADHLIGEFRETMEMPTFDSWESVEERTSPTADSFGKRDLVVACVRTLAPPHGWSVDVSRISRITLRGGVKFTGAMVVVRDQRHVIIRQAAVSFEDL